MNNIKNVLIISSDFCLEAGGIQNTSYLLAEELSQYTNVFTASPSDSHVLDKPGVKTFKGKYSNKRGEIDLFHIEAINIVENIHKEYHIDYVLNTMFPFALAAYHLKNKFGVPYGIMAHGNEVMKLRLANIINHPRSGVKKWFWRIRLFNNATHIFTNTAYTKGLVKKITNNKNIHIINPPISICPDNIDINRLPDKNGVVLYIGRLVERKGVQNVIKALPSVLNRVPNLKFFVAGTGEFEDDLKMLVNDCNVSDSVFFRGRVSEEEKIKLLSECDLFIMPSIELKKSSQVEGFGISLLEANAYGKFVISTKSGGIPEAVNIGETGFLVEENDVREIAEAMTRFYDGSFSYNPAVCVSWARKRHISEIAKQYMDVIRNK